MSEWGTYALADFLLFSPRTYYRLFELYNFAIWPLQLAGTAAGLTIAALLLANGASPGRLIAALLAACWLWIAWAFHYQRYAQINWAAPWFGAAFAMQGVLLGALGTIGGGLDFRKASRRRRRIAATIVAIAVVAYPLLAPAAGRSWTTAESFGTTPDPTAIGTVAVIALSDARVRWLLLVVPLLWCIVAAATLWAMNAFEALAVAVATVGVLALTLCGTRPGAGGTLR